MCTGYGLLTPIDSAAADPDAVNVPLRDLTLLGLMSLNMHFVLPVNGSNFVRFVIDILCQFLHWLGCFRSGIDQTPNSLLGTWL